jgi:hypothetical protein
VVLGSRASKRAIVGTSFVDLEVTGIGSIAEGAILNVLGAIERTVWKARIVGHRKFEKCGLAYCGMCLDLLYIRMRRSKD